jgi:hypothetical protein
MDEDIRGLLPQHKSDYERAQAIIARGYPAVAPVLPELITWLQDCNWPVSHVIAPFLASIGSPIVPEIRRVLQTNDDIWKYWVLSQVVARTSSDVAEGLREELTRIATEPTQGEILEDVSSTAQAILQKIGQTHS